VGPYLKNTLPKKDWWGGSRCRALSSYLQHCKKKKKKKKERKKETP
jgi:hypothetical protein